jgi:hypothetical protein
VLGKTLKSERRKKSQSKDATRTYAQMQKLLKKRAAEFMNFLKE